MANRPSDLSLKFSTDIEMTDGTIVAQTFNFKIKAIARGNVSLTKDVIVEIVICGSETISLVDSAIYEKVMDIGPTATEF